MPFLRSLKRPKRPDLPPTGLRVLCFGDSLTSGWSQRGTVQQPYAQVLRSRLESWAGSKVEVHVNGAPGQTVTSPEWAGRLASELQEQRDWIIILGGTNDLGYGKLPSEIFASLCSSWQSIIAAGPRVLALTVPETQANGERLVERRGMLNQHISAFTCRNYYTFDLHRVIPYHSLTAKQLQLYWDDGVHLTAEGYDWMGGHIADAMISILGKAQP